MILALAAAGSPEIQDIFQDENVEAMQCGREVWKMDDDLFGNILVEKLDQCGKGIGDHCGG